MIQSNTSSPWESGVSFESQGGWWQLKSPRMKKFLEEGGMEGKKESVLPFVGEKQMEGGINIKKRERGGAVMRNVDPYIIRVGIKRRKKGGRKLRKG